MDSEPCPPGDQDRHPIHADWRNGHASSFLTLNALAEAVRRLEAVPEFDTVLFDLRQPRLYTSALHVIRCADLIARSHGVSVRRFFAQGQETVPDFTIDSESREYPVEAKLLTGSDTEELFKKWAAPVIDALLDGEVGLLAEPYWLRVVLETSTDLPLDADVIAVARSLSRPPIGRCTRRRWEGHTFIIGASPCPALPDGLIVAPAPIVTIMAPRNPKEALRVFNRCRQASRQLRSFGGEHRSGILFLGGDVVHHARYLAELLEARLNCGKYTGMGAAFLHAWYHTSEAEGFSVAERLAVSTTPSPASELISRVSWGALGALEGLLPPPGFEPAELPAYQCARTQRSIRAGSGEVLWMPQVYGIPREWLRN